MKKYVTKNLLLLLNLITYSGMAQVNIAGKPGLINIPTARVLSEGSFHIGYHYNPIRNDYRLNNPNPIVDCTGQRSSSTFFVHLAMLKRLELSVCLFRINGYIPLDSRGIGDRQLDVKYAVLLENKSRPSVVIIASAPFGVDNSLIAYSVVATKNVSVIKSITAEVTAGFGSPYYFDRSDNHGNDFNIFSNYKLHNKNDRPIPYLSGLFGGVNFRLAKKVGLMVEWDARQFNAGAYITLFNHWTIQAGISGFDQLTFGTSYAVSLLQFPKRLRSKPEHLTQ
ncbi:YjbH domain-containing protein [Spirosoma fluminis]